MSDQHAQTPQTFIARHGDTEWSQNGRFTGVTDIDLTQKGISQVCSSAKALVGKGKLVDPRHISRIYVSPRRRAVHTLELLLPIGSDLGAENIVLTEDIAEWNYGDYEGLKDHEIRLARKEKGLDQGSEWDLWSQGCEAGESPQQVSERLDRLILEIKKIQEPCMRGEAPANVLIIAHGLILRAFAKRWIHWSLDQDLPMEMQPGGIAVLTYKHNDVNRPALNLGLALPGDGESAQI